MSDSAGNQAKSCQISIPKSFQRVLSRMVPGPTSPQNKFSIDWGWQGFVAYGAQNSVIVVDPVTLQVAQTLCQHRSHVVKVRWRKTRHYHHLGAAYSLVLASSDATGTIIIWNVSQGDSFACLQDGNKPVTELEWLGNKDGSEHLLAALHPPYSLILWDTRHSSKVWKKSYTEILFSFHFDPFHLNKLAFLCNGCILFVNDFSTVKCPSSNGKRFFLSSPISPTKSGPVSTPEDKGNSSSILRRKVKELVTGEVKSKHDDPCQISECILLLYHRAAHDQILLVYPREILLIDLVINQTVGIIPIDRGATPIMQVISCWQRDVLFCLHESGSIAGYFRRQYHCKEGNSHPDGGVPYAELLYERKCYSEPLRLGKSNRPIGFAHNPVSEKSLALTLGDGRVVFKELIPHSQSGGGSWMGHYSPRREGSLSSSPSFQKVENIPELSIKDNYFSPEYSLAATLSIPNISLIQIAKPPFDCNESIGKINGNLRIIMVGLMPSLSPPPLVIRMCPPLTTKNISEYTPLLAVGTHSGTVQVINLATGMIEREFSLHTYPVKGIEWTSLCSFISFANQPLSNTHGLVRNELIHTDVRTGYSITLRMHETEESPIEMIKISYLKQYFIIILKDDPFELWDCQKLVPLRTMSRRFPKVTAFEWSPTTHIRARKESLTAADPKKDKDGNGEDSCSMSSSLSSSSLSLQSSSDENSLIKETMVFTDTEGQLYHFSVKGNIIKHVTKTPPDTQRNMITCIAFKSNEIVLSDSDGTMTIWDLKSRVFRNINTHRGLIKKMRYAPGKDNMKLLVLHNDGVDIWDIREVILISQLKCPKDMAKILDIDWGASDCPILATVDGCLRVMDINLKKCSSPMNQYFTKEPIISPYLLSSEATLNLRTMITHQPWKDRYSLTFTTDDGFTPAQLSDINVWISRIPAEVQDYLETCDSVAHRALIASHLFGDEGELLFWMVATHYLTHMSKNPNTIGKQDKLIDIPPSEDAEEAEILSTPLSGSLLDLSFYHLCDNYTYKKHELERLFLQEIKDLTGTLRDSLGRKLGVIGERDRVVRLLLDEDSSEAHFYTDCLRACLLSATHHSTQAQSTIKLVATNLIAAGNIWEGIELLCIIGKALDACRYLQSYGHWDDSIWLAKCILSPRESSDIYKRWAAHLISSGNKDMAVCSFIAGGVISSSLNQLVQQHYHQRAALLLDAAQQFMLPVSGRASGESASNSPIPTSSDLFESIFRKYTYYLFGLGNQNAALHFCQKIGGEAGQELMKEFSAGRS